MPQMIIWNSVRELEKIEQTVQLYTFIFGGIIFTAMFIAFFTLVATMYVNIQEHKKDIAIIRILGITKFQIYRIFIIESFLVIFASCLLGLIIGTATSWSLFLQQTLRSEVPLTFPFPLQLFSYTFGLSIFFSFFASYIPIRNVNSKILAQILKDG